MRAVCCSRDDQRKPRSPLLAEGNHSRVSKEKAAAWLAESLVHKVHAGVTEPRSHPAFSCTRIWGCVKTMEISTGMWGFYFLPVNFNFVWIWKQLSIKFTIFTCSDQFFFTKSNSWISSHQCLNLLTLV